MEEKQGEVEKLFENGLLKQDENGNYQAVLNPEESEYIKSEVSKIKMRKTMSPEEAD